VKNVKANAVMSGRNKEWQHGNNKGEYEVRKGPKGSKKRRERERLKVKHERKKETYQKFGKGA
jgi:hypothetical protein